MRHTTRCCGVLAAVAAIITARCGGDSTVQNDGGTDATSETSAPDAGVDVDATGGDGAPSPGSSCPTPQATDIVKYVSTTGNDASDGSLAAPWKTLSHAVSQLVPGDTLYARGGVYTEVVQIHNSGASGARINVLAYPGETPVVDGNNYAMPSTLWDALIQLYGNYITVCGFTAQNSAGQGIRTNGDNNEILNSVVQGARGVGLMVYGNYDLAQGNLVTNASNMNAVPDAGTWAAGMTLSGDYTGPKKVSGNVARNNVSHDNWGEGLSTFSADGTLIEGNTVYNNWSVNVYVENATNITVRDNIVYHSTDVGSSFHRGNIEGGIGFANEVADSIMPWNDNLTIVNNLVFGCAQNVYWWIQISGSYVKNTLVAGNTLLGAVGYGNINIGQGNHQNFRVIDNVVWQPASSTVPLAAIASPTSMTFQNNAWSKSVSTSVASAGDVVGDPKLSMAGSTTGGALVADYFRILSGSPVIGKGTYLSEVPVDYLGVTRSNPPTIGAFENPL